MSECNKHFSKNGHKLIFLTVQVFFIWDTYRLSRVFYECHVNFFFRFIAGKRKQLKPIVMNAEKSHRFEFVHFQEKFSNQKLIVLYEH